MFDEICAMTTIDYTPEVYNRRKEGNIFNRKYTPPEKTGDDLLDEMLELMEYRAWQRTQNVWKEFLDSFSNTRKQYNVTMVTATQPKR